MKGFMNTSLNEQIAFGILNHIIDKVLECFDLMILDCQNNSKKITNNEIAIRDYLFSNYLNKDIIMKNIGFDNFRFFSEVPENYVDSNPQGRADLQVFSIDEFRHRERYFTIECKRVDGNLTLNRKYIDEGMRRFVGNTPKYTSYYKMNCMMGFIIKNIDIGKNVEGINGLLQSDYSDINVQNYLHEGGNTNAFISSHGEDMTNIITLVHVFPDCTSFI